MYSFPSCSRFEIFFTTQGIYFASKSAVVNQFIGYVWFRRFIFARIVILDALLDLGCILDTAFLSVYFELYKSKTWWQATIHARHVNERSELNVAGPEGIEPPIEVLETSVIPFNYGPRRVPMHYKWREGLLAINRALFERTRW